MHADWELVLATSFGFLGFRLGSVTHLSSEEAWDDPSLIFLDKSLAPFIPIFCFAFPILSFPGSFPPPPPPFFFLLFSQLACWSACPMMNSLHGYSDPSVSWQGQAYSLLGYRRPRIYSSSPVMSSLGWTALKLTLGLSSRPAQIWNQRLLATSTAVHSLELVSLIAYPRYFIFL